MQRKPNVPGLPEALSRRRLLQLGVAGTALLGTERVAAAATADAGPASADRLDEVTVDQLQAWMASGEETSRSIVQRYLDRIAQRDGRVRSVLETNPDALAQAEGLDRERKAGNVRGPLHGIPVLLKDNIATKDRMHTTAGSLALMEATVPADAFLVGRLREAGVTDAELSRLSSPIGLDLGARTPEETAISIAAEIIALRWGGQGRRLIEEEGPIHHQGASG